jgi:hypothetical protein
MTCRLPRFRYRKDQVLCTCHPTNRVSRGDLHFSPLRPQFFTVLHIVNKTSVYRVLRGSRIPLRYFSILLLVVISTEIVLALSYSRILELPAELIGNICEHLDNDALRNIFLVSRHLANHSTFSFGTRFFGSLTAILHPVSLGVLLETSRHPTLSTYIKTLVFSSHNYEDDLMSNEVEDQSWAPHIRAELIKRRDTLVETLYRFPSLRTVEISDP